MIMYVNPGYLRLNLNSLYVTSYFYPNTNRLRGLPKNKVSLKENFPRPNCQKPFLIINLTEYMRQKSKNYFCLKGGLTQFL